MQEVLRRLGQQQNVQSQETPLRQQQSSEPFQHNAVIHRLRQTVAEREASIKDLEDQIQQLSVEVKPLKCKTMGMKDKLNDYVFQLNGTKM